MIDELRKSINATLYERVSSPFYGTAILSWLIWNWEIPYLTFIISEDQIEGTKLDYISTHYSNIHNLVTWPLLSTIILLTIIPFISNGAYYLSLLFKQWRTNKRNEVENKQLLSIEKSIALREEIRSQEEKFEKLLESKNEEVKILTQQIETFRERINEAEKSKEVQEPKTTRRKRTTSPQPKTDDYTKEFDEILSNDFLIQEFSTILRRIQGGARMMSGTGAPSTKAVAYYESHGLISNKAGTYSFTEKGSEFVKRYSERQI